jgi:hypothetical protein
VIKPSQLNKALIARLIRNHVVRSHAVPRPRLQTGQGRRRHPGATSLPRASQHPAHRAIYGARARSVQRFLARLAWRTVGAAPTSNRFRILVRMSPAALSMLTAELAGAKQVSSVGGTPLPLMPAFLRTLRLAVRGVLFCFRIELVGRSGRRLPSPDTRRRPDQKSLQAEATTCRSPGTMDCPGFFFVTAKMFSSAARTLPERVSCEPHCSNIRMTDGMAGTTSIINDYGWAAPVSNIGAAGRQNDCFLHTKLRRGAKARGAARHRSQARPSFGGPRS